MIRSEFLKKWALYLGSERWNNWGGGFRVWGHGGFAYIADLVPKNVKKILELGCADGYLLHLLNEKGYEAHGVTYAEGEYRACKDRKLNAILADMHDLPFEDNSFDAIVTRQTLEHAISLFVVLKECDRVVKPNGYLIIHVPKTLDGTDENPEHINSLTPIQWKVWTEKWTSFKVIREGFEDSQGAYWLIAKKEAV